MCLEQSTIDIASIEHYHWFYSTLAQSIAAFLGIVGVFAVFRLQIQHLLVEKAFERIRDFLSAMDPRSKESEISSMNYEELLKHADGLNNLWAAYNRDYGDKIHKWENDPQAHLLLGQIGAFKDKINRNNNLMKKLIFLKRECVHGYSERNLISGQSFYILKHLLIALAISFVVLFLVRFLASIKSMLVCITLLFFIYLFWIGKKLVNFFERCLKGDFFIKAFK